MQYITSLEQLDELIGQGSKDSIMLGGELTFVTHSKDAIDDLDDMDDEQYIVQPKRKASKGRGKANLYVALDKQAVDRLDDFGGSVYIAADQYLAYGLSLRENTIVIGGGLCQDQNSISLEAYVFSDSSLVETYEKTASFSGMMIDLMVKELIDRYPNHAVHWLEPLPEPPFCDVSELESFRVVGFAAGSLSIKRKIFTRKQGVDESWEPIPAILIALAGVAIFTSAIGWSWMGLQKERAAFAAEIRGYEESYQNSAQSLELLRHRDFLLREESSGKDVIDMLDILLGRVSSLERVIIHKVEVFSPKDAERSQIQTESGMITKSDFVVELSVPQMESSARVQGEAIIRGLSQRSGLNFRLISHRQTTVSSNGVDRDYWRYQLMGSKPDAI